MMSFAAADGKAHHQLNGQDSASGKAHQLNGQGAASGEKSSIVTFLL